MGVENKPKKLAPGVVKAAMQEHMYDLNGSSLNQVMLFFENLGIHFKDKNAFQTALITNLGKGLCSIIDQKIALNLSDYEIEDRDDWVRYILQDNGLKGMRTTTGARVRSSAKNHPEGGDTLRGKNHIKPSRRIRE